MLTQTAKTNLCNVLAGLYPDENSARGVVEASGLNAHRIIFIGSSINIWRAILTEAEREDKVEDVLKVAFSEYPNNNTLREAVIECNRVHHAPPQDPPSAPDTSTPVASMLLILSAFAAWISITVFVAIYVKQDPLLILLTTIAAVIIAAITYWAIRIIRPSLPLVLIVFIGSSALVIFAWSLLASLEVTFLEVDITYPINNEPVTWEANGISVGGKVSDPNARVYVLVRTLPASQWWVQQPASVDGNGNWTASSVYFGDKIIDSEEKYEMIALATADNSLITWATGNPLGSGKLSSLPRKSNKSSLITVTRSPNE